MKPRLPSSKKWTPFPKEFSEQIQGVFKENFNKELKKAELIVEGRIYPQEIILRIGYLEAGRLRQANFEISVEYSAKTNDAVDRINDAVDAAASMMMEYFEVEQDPDQEHDFPLSWKEVPFNNRKLFMQFSTENTKLEAEADALLGKTDKNLINIDENSEADSAEDFRQELENDEDPEEINEESGEDEDPQPKMFGGRKPKKKTQLH